VTSMFCAGVLRVQAATPASKKKKSSSSLGAEYSGPTPSASPALGSGIAGSSPFFGPPPAKVLGTPTLSVQNMGSSSNSHGNSPTFGTGPGTGQAQGGGGSGGKFTNKAPTGASPSATHKTSTTPKHQPQPQFGAYPYPPPPSPHTSHGIYPSQQSTHGRNAQLQAPPAQHAPPMQQGQHLQSPGGSTGLYGQHYPPTFRRSTPPPPPQGVMSPHLLYGGQGGGGGFSNHHPQSQQHQQQQGGGYTPHPGSANSMPGGAPNSNTSGPGGNFNRSFRGASDLNDPDNNFGLDHGSSFRLGGVANSRNSGGGGGGGGGGNSGPGQGLAYLDDLLSGGSSGLESSLQYSGSKLLLSNLRMGSHDAEDQGARPRLQSGSSHYSLMGDESPQQSQHSQQAQHMAQQMAQHGHAPPHGMYPGYGSFRAPMGGSQLINAQQQAQGQIGPNHFLYGHQQQQQQMQQLQLQQVGQMQQGGHGHNDPFVRDFSKF
jgi:hypothetical protein